MASETAISALTPEGRARIEALLSKAGEDIEFREQLMRDPNAVLTSTNLTDEEKGVLGTMRRVALEEWGVDVRRYRAFLRDNGNKASLIPPAPVPEV